MFKIQQQKWYQAWLNRRIPAASHVVLDRRRIFIFPSALGFAYIVLLIIILIAAINYQNNMAYLLAFFLASLFFVVLNHSYANLSGVKLQAAIRQSVFCGDEQPIHLTLSHEANRERFNIYCAWPLSASQHYKLNSNETVEKTIAYPTFERGLLQLPRLLVETNYPLGLFRVWSWVDLDVNAVVYPKPVEGLITSESPSDAESYQITSAAQDDEFYQLRPYQQGDNIKHVHWRHYAKSQQLTMQQFASATAAAMDLNWKNVEGSTEARLSILCYWALQLEQAQQPYSLTLPNKQVEKNCGHAHLHDVLSALALYKVR